MWDGVMVTSWAHNPETRSITLVRIRLPQQIYKDPWRNWLAHLTHNQGVNGSSPLGSTKCRNVGIGRQDGLKIHYPKGVRVRLPLSIRKNQIEII